MVVLALTAPGLGQNVYKVQDPDTGDSVAVADCSGGPPLVERLRVYLYFWPLGSTPSPIPVDSLQCDPGAAVSFTSRGAGTYWVRAANSRGFSCESNQAVIPGSVSGVPVEATDRIQARRLFDVRGRLVRGPPASGIYFERSVWRSGRVTVKRRVVLH